MGSIDRDVYRAIAQQRGLHATSERMIEAMAELTQAITRFWRYDGINQVLSTTAETASPRVLQTWKSCLNN